MSITVLGPAGSCEFPWFQYALLRDNVRHHFERGDGSGAFSELHRIAEAASGRIVVARALLLHEQLARAQALCLLPISKLAISAQTQAVLDPEQGDVPTLSTQLIGANHSLPWVGEKTQTLGDVFGNVCAALLAITEGAREADVVEVIDG